MIACHIKVTNRNERIEIIADEEKNRLVCNKKVIKKDASKFIADLLSIVSYWPKESFNDAIASGEEYDIKIFFEDETRSYRGANKFPFNYISFRKLISEVTQ